MRTQSALMFCLFLFTPSLVMAGTVVYKNMYATNSFLIGEGLTPQKAAMDAFSSMPPNYEPDRKNSQYVECTAELAQESDEEGVVCDTSIPGNHYRLIQPIVESKDSSQH